MTPLCNFPEGVGMNTEVIAGKVCYVMEHGNVKVAVTRQGGHMAPVTFFHNQNPDNPNPDNQNKGGGMVKPVQPYYISPWQGETAETDAGTDTGTGTDAGRTILPVLQPLRGDLFCMPFGGDGEEFPPHGETASHEWHPAGIERNGTLAVMTLEMQTRIRPGSVTKEITAVSGHDALYIRHTVRGNAGSMTYGHHATLGVHNGPLTIRTSPIRFGFTSPHADGFTQNKDYFSLASTARFDSLTEVPTIWKDPAYTDCSLFPARYGFMDVLQVYQEQLAEPGWVTAVCAEGGYLWYSFKDVSILPSTAIWMDNCGRHATLGTAGMSASKMSAHFWLHQPRRGGIHHLLHYNGKIHGLHWQGKMLIVRRTYLRESVKSRGTTIGRILLSRYDQWMFQQERKFSVILCQERIKLSKLRLRSDVRRQFFAKGVH